MQVMSIIHPSDGLGKYYMAVADESEWRELVDFLFENASTTMYDGTMAWKLVKALEGWGIN